MNEVDNIDFRQLGKDLNAELNIESNAVNEWLYDRVVKYAKTFQNAKILLSELNIHVFPNTVESRHLEAVRRRIEDKMERRLNDLEITEVEGETQ